MTGDQVREKIEQAETMLDELMNHTRMMQRSIDWSDPYLNENTKAMRVREIHGDLQGAATFLAKVKENWSRLANMEPAALAQEEQGQDIGV